MGTRKFMNGNSAVAYAVKLVEPDVIAAYPITPQSSIVEKISDYVSAGEMNSELIKVESEHSAMSACFGAACAGCRVFTATSAQGLAYMSEVLPYMSGNRLPAVMAVVNRGMAAPWTIWGDQQDAVSQRDQGWIQIYTENAQDAFDTCIQAFRLAELNDVQLPVMVCLDGFVVSHTEEVIDVPSKAEVQEFLPAYKAQFPIDFEKPLTYCIGTPPEIYMDYKYQHQKGMEIARQRIKEVALEFEKKFGRNHGALIKEYDCEDAEFILVTMGSVTGTARVVASKLRAAGKKVGVLKVRTFRPFPAEEIAKAVGNASAIAVLERDFSYGYEGALCTEVKAALFSAGKNLKVVNYIAGLGGKDIRPEDIEKIFYQIENERDTVKPVNFVGVRWENDEN